MDRNSKIELLTLLEEKERRVKYRKLNSFYPDTGPLRRELYQKHIKFFNGGAKFRERLILGGNRIGKSEAGGCEMTYHLTGVYPPWWKGRRFETAIGAWAAGTSSEATRDIIQKKLLGPRGEFGTGLIPGHLIVGSPSAKKSVSEGVDTVRVRHVPTGGTSVLQFKSYEQGRSAFEGTFQQVVWLDEEPPIDVYTECLMRTSDTTGTGKNNGILMLTFTPLQGMSETVLQFMPGGLIEENERGSKMVVMVGWDDIPHLTEETKKELLAAIPPFQRDARTKGIPALGAGAIYPVPESDFVVDDFKIPDHFLQVYGLDVGWNRTAVIWAAWDREKDVLFLIGEHYRGQAEPSVHAHGIRSRGEWIPGVIDPAARGRQQTDGAQMLQNYRDLGLDLEIAINAVEAGCLEVWERLSSGRLKVFRSCQNWLEEKRLYRRDEKGRVVKGADHLMDATRYLIMSGLARAKAKPADKKMPKASFGGGSGTGTGWMG